MNKKILPDINDRKFWDGIKNKKRFKLLVNNLIDEASRISLSPIENLKASEFLQFYRTGNRSFYDEKYNKRRENFQKLVLAECFQNKGEFLDSITDYIWAICEETSWTLPCHEISARSYGKGLPDKENPTVALFSGITSLLLSISLYILKEKLNPVVIKRIKYEVEKRIIEPYIEKDFWWLKMNNNWNAVCNNCVIWSAFLTINENKKLKKIVDKAVKSLSLYIKGFDIDGGTSEGINYWNFGFSHYIMAAYILEKSTEGRINLFKQKIIKKIALFPLLVELSPNRFINFADATEYVNIPRTFLEFLSFKLDIPSLKFSSFYRQDTLSLINLYQIYELKDKIQHYKSPPKIPYKKFFFFKGMEWMISRKNPKDLNTLVFAAKCGHNGEMHNHNDVGNFIIHYKRETFISDTGAPIYKRETFSDRRYEMFPCSSAGHSVPVINGFYQKEGEKYRGEIINVYSKRDFDIFEIEIGKAYPENAGIKSFIRKFTLERKGEGKIVLEDSFVLKKPSKIEEAFITFLDVKKKRENKIIIKGEKGKIEIICANKNVELKIEKYSLKEIEKRQEPHIKKDLKRIIWKTKKKNLHFRFHFNFNVF